MDWTTFLILSVFILVIFFLLFKQRQTSRLNYIKNYSFHNAIEKKLSEKHPHLNKNQLQLVFRGLRDYFWMNNKAQHRMVAMPSQVVDDAWHEFILFTRNYQTFCQRALGRYLHHTPSEAMKRPTIAQDGIKRAWRLACANENINPASAHKLPLIFAIDTLLNIPNGFRYSLNCRDTNSPAGDYCAGHIGCSSGCAGDSPDTSSGGGFLDSSGCSGDSGCGGD